MGTADKIPLMYTLYRAYVMACTASGALGVVYGGEVIGTLSDGSGETRKDRKFLHLELWHRSKPIDPNIYIAF